MEFQDENRISQAQLHELERLIGNEVYDKNDAKVGIVESVWEDRTGQPAFLGIRTGWLGLGRIHVVPAHYATMSEKKRRIKLPFDEAVIKGAPEFTSEYEFSDEGESRLYEYYRGQGMDTSFYDREEAGRDWTSGASREEVRETELDEGRSALGEKVEKAKGFLKRDEPRDRETEGDRTIPLSEERLKVGKREVEAGGVRLRKVIRTETVNQPIELQHEEVEIERIPASGETRASGDFEEDEIYIPLRREVADVSKEARVREEIRVNKRMETEQSQVSETLRKEDVDIDRDRDNLTDRTDRDNR
jgi:uncharacterized protein (TIGR02271 family)